MHSSVYIVGQSESRNIKWARHVTRMGKCDIINQLQSEELTENFARTVYPPTLKGVVR
jgi:hypothetical protein